MDQILKLLQLIIGFASSKSQTMSKQLITTIRKIIKFVIIALGSMSLFCVGISIIATNIAQQMNQNIPVAWSGSLTAGLFLSLVSLGSFLYFLSQKTWLKATSIQQEEKRSTSPIEEALAFLIKDFVVERQLKRESHISSTPEA